MLDNEKAILGAICLDPDEALDRINLAADDFTGAHREIYRVMLDLHCQGIKPELVALTNELVRIKKLQEVGGVTYLNELMEFSPTAVNVGYYVKQVREKSQRRKIRGIAEAIQQNADKMPVAEILEKIEATIDGIRGKSEGGPKKISEALLKALNVLEARREHKGQIPGAPTGLTPLDRMLGGIQPSKFYIVAGRPGMGKTALAMDIARHVGKSGKPTLLFSMEMDEAELGERALSSEGKIDNGKMRFGMLEGADFSKLNDAADRLHKSQLWIDDTPVLTASEIRSRAKQIKRKHGIGAVIVDYLQLIDGTGTRYDIVTDASRQLKLLSKEIEAPVIALCQLNRGLENRDDKRPKMADLRESGALEQDADVIMFCYREAIYCDCKGVAECEKNHRRKAQIIIGKHRGGPVGTVNCEYIGEHTTFREAR
jgi:replicative DNA helicase